MKKLVTATIGLIMLAVSGASFASSYYKCLKTKPVKFDGTIAEAAIATDSLSTLVFALQEAGLVDALNGGGNFTVYAPVNEAFGALPPEILNAVLADKDLLTAVLLYHVAEGKKDPRRAFIPKKVSTLFGQTVFLNRSGSTPRVNNSNVECQPVKTSNGTVYLIDSVLMPQF
ncbi:fasciclin domain-containing protein [Corallincola platygyrae]|uniref:Fasciclin domain-containing protein n=1 Tax=Corallincola platygyrae TaxID=1193278 RepID=A0ABW4XKM6_9GAMM